MASRALQHLLAAADAHNLGLLQAVHGVASGRIASGLLLLAAVGHVLHAGLHVRRRLQRAVLRLDSLADPFLVLELVNGAGWAKLQGRVRSLLAVFHL